MVRSHHLWCWSQMMRAHHRDVTMAHFWNKSNLYSARHKYIILLFCYWPQVSASISHNQANIYRKRNHLTLIQLTWRIWWALNKARKWQMGFNSAFKGLNAELNPICHLLALLGAHHILHLSRIRFKMLVYTFYTFYIVHIGLVMAFWGRNTQPIVE